MAVSFRFYVTTTAKDDEHEDGWFIFNVSEGKPTTFRSSYDPTGGEVTRSVYNLQVGSPVQIFYKKLLPSGWSGLILIKSGLIKDVRIENLPS